MMQSPAVRRSLGLALCMSTLGCSVADNLTYSEIATELDAIVRVEGTGATRTVRYAERATVSSWYMRSPLTWPLRWPLGWVFGGRHDSDLENPAGHVRELLVELPDETGSDLEVCTDAFLRLQMLAEFDPSVGMQIAAIDGLCQLSDQLELPLFHGAMDRIGLYADPTRLAAARAAIQLGRPDRRAAQGWDEAQKANYCEGLTTIVERPLIDGSDRLGLVADLGGLWRTETEATVRVVAEQALRRALVHSLELLLVRTVQGRDPQFADVRLCAMQQIRRIGGPPTVPLLLAVMAASAGEVRNGGRERFDPDSLIQLRLIHLCGQVRGDLALQALRLPAREDWEPIAPVDFLAETVLNERDYFSKLRIPAMTALSLCLERPRISYDRAWVQEWYRSRQRRS